MASLSAYDRERLIHINSVMDEMNQDISGIYEALVDREFDELISFCEALTEKVEDLKQSVDKDI